MIKTLDEIKAMRKGGSILKQALYHTLEYVKPGISERELDQIAEDYIRRQGAESGFKKVKGYKHTICACVNDVVVHGVPGSYVLRDGDLICVDMGVYYQGFHTDMAETILVANPGASNKEDDDKKRFLSYGKKALLAAIKQAKPGKHIGHISKAIQDIVEEEGGYSIVRSLIGHGVGRNLHEEPEVPGYLVGRIEKTPRLVPGMTIAIEVIYNMGKPEVVYAGTDDWTIKTKDGSLSAVFERTVLITNNEPEVLT